MIQDRTTQSGSTLQRPEMSAFDRATYIEEAHERSPDKRVESFVMKMEEQMHPSIIDNKRRFSDLIDEDEMGEESPYGMKKGKLKPSQSKKEVKTREEMKMRVKKRNGEKRKKSKVKRLEESKLEEQMQT